MIDISKNASGIAYVFDVLQHLVLPAVTLALVYLAFYARLARASMMEVLDADYIRTARAKGVSERNVLLRHALRLDTEAKALEQAVHRAISAGALTADLAAPGMSITTRAASDAVLAEL